METELLVATFDNLTGADAMLETLKDLQFDDFIELLDAVIVTKDLTGKVEVRQPLEVGPGKGAVFGALTGAVVGLLGGPAGAIVGFVSGAVTGGVAGAAFEANLPEADIRALALDELDPGDSALLVYFDQVWIEQIEQAARDLGAEVTRRVIAEERRIEREARKELLKEKVEAAYQSWQAKLDQQRATVASLHQRVSTALQADRDTVQKQIAQANSQLDQTFQNILHRLQVWQQQVEADITALEVQIKQANANAKADLNQHLAAAKQSRQTLHSKVKDTLSSRLDHLKSEAEALKVQAAQAQGQAQDKLNARVAKLQADIAAEGQRLDQLEKADDAAWDGMAKTIDEAITGYWAALDEAENEFEAKHN
jgi:uncharacterized membrane protein